MNFPERSKKLGRSGTFMNVRIWTLAPTTVVKVEKKFPTDYQTLLLFKGRSIFKNILTFGSKSESHKHFLFSKILK